MQIQLKQAELETAVRDFINKMGVSREVASIDFTASRGSAGIITEVELSDGAAKPTKPATVASVPANKKASGEAKPAPEKEPEDAPFDGGEVPTDAPKAEAPAGKSLFA